MKAFELSKSDAGQLAMWAQLQDQQADSATAVLEHLGLLQVDFTLAPAHLLTCLTRMPEATQASRIEAEAGWWQPGPARVFETYTHAACILPVEDWPLLRLARQKAAALKSAPPDADFQTVLTCVRSSESGVTREDLQANTQSSRGWSAWSPAKRALEHLLWRGEIICSERRDGQWIYDLPERRLAPEIPDIELPREDILRALIAKAITAMGIASAAGIACYYNLKAAQVKEGLALYGAEPVKVGSIREPYWLPLGSNTAIEPKSYRSSLLGPFDNLLRDRGRLSTLHDFNYTFEAYKPAAQRQYGHYVMALLSTKGTLIGRAAMARNHQQLLVERGFPENGIPKERFDDELDTALATLAAQLELEPIRVH